MSLLEVNEFICEYYYEDNVNEIYTMRGYSLKYLQHKIMELLDAELKITYKIYGVIEEGVEYP